MTGPDAAVGLSSGADSLLVRTGAVIVTGIEPALALRCARSLAPVLPRERIIVVVNPPGTEATVLGELEEIAQVVRNAELTGYGACLNRGVALLPAEANLLLLLNDDVVVDVDGLRALAGELDERPEVAIAGPNLVGLDGKPQETVFPFPSVGLEVAQALILPRRVQQLLRRGAARQATPGPPHVVDVVLGAAMLIRRDAFERAAGFDEGFLLYSEETDLCLRLERQGWKTISCGDVTFVHDGGASTVAPRGRATEEGRRFASMIGPSRARYVRIHWGAGRRVTLVGALAAVYVWNLLYIGVRVLVAPSTRGAKVALLRAHWDSRPVFRRKDAHR